MKRTVKKIISLVLVLAVLMTSMIVSSVGATASNPLQTVLTQVLQLNYAAKGEVAQALSAIKNDQAGAVADAKAVIIRLVPTIPNQDDIEAALEQFDGISSDDQDTIINSILLFSFTSQNYSGNDFDTIVTKLNTMLTGEAVNTGDVHDGVSLIIQALEFLHRIQESGVYVQDGASVSNYVDFVCNPTNALFSEAVSQISTTLNYMETVKNKITPFSGDTNFEKLLNYAESVINSSSIPAAERTALKAFLNKIDGDYYKEPSSSSVPSGGTGGGVVPTTPVVSGDTATVTPDQIKTDDLIAKAGTSKEIAITIDSKDAKTVKAGLPSDLFSKAKAKGITKIEIKTSDVTLDVAPDFVAGAASAKSVSFEIKKVTVTDDIKAKMSDAQKKLLTGNDTILDFSAALIAADGTETKITKFDKPVTIKVKYTLKPGESKDTITVLYLADDGSVQNLVGRYDETTGEVSFTTNHFSMYLVKDNKITFDDVKAGAWYKTQAESLAAKGIISGTTTGGKYNLSPDASVTRAQYVTMLVLALGILDENATADFTDVKKTDWFYKYVASAVKAGITAGVGNGKFAPNSSITRQDMATMLVNTMSDKTIDADKYLTSSDAASIRTNARNAVAICVKNEFLTESNGKINPKGTATRGMAAVVIYKYFNFVF